MPRLQPTVKQGTANWLHGIAQKFESSDDVAAAVVLDTVFAIKEIKERFDDPRITAGLYGDGESDESEQ